MSDIFSKTARSKIMSRIRKTNTKPEVQVRRFLHANGLRFKLHDKRLPGCPDIVLPKHQTIVLVNGCFWHQHRNCDLANFPRSNLSYWRPKLRKNVQRDQKNLRALRKTGWKVFIVWECEVSREQSLRRIVENLLATAR